jgi:hypothetical protein
MGKAVDEAKRRVWRQRLVRFARSGQTVAAFCAAEGVAAPTFYQWKRALASGTERPKGRQAGTSLPGDRAEAFLPLRIEGTARVEIELPNGARVRVPAGDHALLEAAIAAAGRAPLRAPAEATRC